MKISNKRVLHRLLLIVLVTVCVFAPIGAFAYYDSPPDAAHRLIEIFPDAGSPELAADIAKQISAKESAASGRRRTTARTARVLR